MVENFNDKNSFTAISIYKDFSGLLRLCKTGKEPTIDTSRQDQRQVKIEPNERVVEEDVDDIDAMLYGNESKSKRNFY